MLSNFDIMTIEELENSLRKIVDNVHCYSCDKVKTKTIYLAGPWFTPTANALEKAAANIYNNVAGRSDYNLFRPRVENKDTPYETFHGNIEAIDNADLVVALISEKDVGTAFEIGYAKAQGKNIVLVGYDESDFERKTNLMLAFSANACITIDKLWRVYTNCINLEKDCVKTDYCWRNIE